MKEIERKFLVKEMPDLSGIVGIDYERYFLKIEPDFEERIQKKGDKYELEKKHKESNLSRENERQEISRERFEALKKNALGAILREGYVISENPLITVKIYHGDYEGLARAEVEFSSEEEAREYMAPEWMGKEITDTEIGKDSKLIKLNRDEFIKFINKN